MTTKILEVASVEFELVRQYLTEFQQTELMSAVCRRLKEKYDAEPLYYNIPRVPQPRESGPLREPLIGAKPDPGPAEPIGEPVNGPSRQKVGLQLNPEAIEILNQALLWGCMWAEEEIRKISAQYPGEIES